MDPNSTLAMVDELVRERKYRRARLFCADLRLWLVQGGFAPEWSRWERGTRYYVRQWGHVVDPYGAPVSVEKKGDNA